jgi:hypothetical protein
MSSPEPELERQARRHIGPLVGMALVVAFAGILFTYWVFDEVESSTQPLSDTSQNPTLPQGTGEGQEQTMPGANEAVPDADETPPAPDGG